MVNNPRFKKFNYKKVRESNKNNNLQKMQMNKQKILKNAINSKPNHNHILSNTQKLTEANISHQFSLKKISKNLKKNNKNLKINKTLMKRKMRKFSVS